jgi:hypothetical protein
MATAHQFKKGHRILIQVQNSWFPLVDINPQSFVNIYEADKKDFNKTTEIEPYFTNAYSNRAFTTLKKHELGNVRTIKKIEGIRIMATKETKIPETELKKICEDLKKAVSLGDNNQMVLEALKKHCEK